MRAKNPAAFGPATQATLGLVAMLAALAFVHALPSEARAAASTVTVAKSPSEGGTVTGEGIDCGNDCEESFEAREHCEGGEPGFPGACYDYWGTDLKATPADRYAFDRLENCPGPWQNHCNAWLEAGESRTLTAHFRLAECADGKNNDASDEKVDYPEDPDCESPNDDTEATTPPPLKVTPESIGLTNDNTPTLEFSSTESGVTFRCMVIADEPFYEPVPGHVFDNYTDDNCTSPFTTRALPEGDAIISIWARDAKGYESWKRLTLTVDTKEPDTSITSGPSGTDRSTSPSFDFSASEADVKFECRLDGGEWSACSSPKGYTSLGDGQHTFEVAAIDRAGNRDPDPAKRTWTIDSTGPKVTEVSPVSGATGVPAGTNVIATFSEAMNRSTFSRATVRLVRKGTTRPVSATVSYDSTLKRAKLDPANSLRRGATYKATVTTGVKDRAGNPLKLPRTWSFTVRR